MISNRAKAREARAQILLDHSASKAAKWADYIAQGFPQAKQTSPPLTGLPDVSKLAVPGIGMAEWRGVSTLGQRASEAGNLVAYSLFPESAVAANPDLTRQVSDTWSVVRNVTTRAQSSRPAPPAPSRSFGSAIQHSFTDPSLSTAQIDRLLRAFKDPAKGAEFLDALAGLLPKDEAKFAAAASRIFRLPDFYSHAGDLLSGSTSFNDFVDALGTAKGAAAALNILTPFLPPGAQKLAGVAGAAAGAALSGGEFTTKGALDTAIGFLPPEYQKYVRAAYNLAYLKPTEFLQGLFGEFLPPEAKALFGAIAQAGGLDYLLSALDIPNIPLLDQVTGVQGAAASAPSAVAVAPGAAQPLAARITDTQVCPAGSGTIIGPCCPTVLIGGLIAARQTDSVVCPGGTDVIVKGEETVLIGKLPAARFADPTAHGGKITSGCASVLIGKLYTGPYEPVAIAGGSSASGAGDGGDGGSGNDSDPSASGQCLEKQAGDGKSFILSLSPGEKP